MTPPTPRIFLGLYGLNRSLRWTRRSIVTNFVRPIERAGFPLRTAAHFNMPRVISNIQSQEHGVAHSNAGWTRLPLDAVLMEDQTTDPLAPEVRKWMQPAFPEDTDEDWQTRRNLIYQLHSIARLWALCGLMGAQDSDVFLFLRPDLEYLDPIDIRAVTDQIVSQGVDLVTAEWGKFGGLNDRFAFCSRKGAAAYVARLDHVDAFCCARGFLQAEELLQTVAEGAGLRLGHTAIRGMRVRSNGSTWRETFKLTPTQFVRSVARKRLVRLGLPSY